MPTSRIAGIQPLSDRTQVPAHYFTPSERFCAQAPLSGSIVYATSHGFATLTASIGVLPPNAQIAVNWENGNSGRAYVVASFLTTGLGSADQSTMKFYRPGEARADRIYLSLNDPQAPVVGELTACS
jgi:hypothetical protein